ncbi:MAG TPA: SOS response-associated peptidase family protein [Methylotenera sp.]
MCSNFRPIRNHHAQWVKQNFGCNLPNSDWREEAYPTYPAPFIYLDNGKPRCELAQFGLVPLWAADKKKFGLHTYNARSETVHEKPSYRRAWKERRFGLVLVESFYEPNWESGKAVRWCIRRSDSQPAALASIWERFVDRETGEIIFSFSMLTINADGHEIMKHFHRPEDERRSVVVLDESEYQPWLHADHELARGMLDLATSGFLVSEAEPR